MIYATKILCRCGGNIEIQDKGSTAEGRKLLAAYGSLEFRFEAFCNKCKDCDPNGWESLKRAKKEAAIYFAEAEAKKGKP